MPIHFNKTEPEYRAILERTRWPHVTICPRCKSYEVCKLQGQAGVKGQFKCRGCQRKFTVRTGTPLEHSRLNLLLWGAILQRLCNWPWGMTTYEMHRDFNITRKSARRLHGLIHEHLIQSAGRDDLPSQELVVERFKPAIADKTAARRSDKKRANAISLYPHSVAQMFRELLGVDDTQHDVESKHPQPVEASHKDAQAKMPLQQEAKLRRPKAKQPKFRKPRPKKPWKF